jgi:hypothetical protein
MSNPSSSTEPIAQIDDAQLAATDSDRLALTAHHTRFDSSA